MGLINFKDIDFKQSIDKELKTFDFNGSEIAVVPYLSINDKYDLVMLTLKKSLEKGVYNHVKLDMYFDLHLIYMYTNIQIDASDREDEAALYDTFKRSGLIEKVIEQIDENEIETLYSYIWEMEELMMNYYNSFSFAISDILEQIPDTINKAKEIIETLDQAKITKLTELIKGSEPTEKE